MLSMLWYAMLACLVCAHARFCKFADRAGGYDDFTRYFHASGCGLRRIIGSRKQARTCDHVCIFRLVGCFGIWYAYRSLFRRCDGLAAVRFIGRGTKCYKCYMGLAGHAKRGKTSRIVSMQLGLPRCNRQR